jgi:DNA-binding PadR family transcriptional regulator
VLRLVLQETGDLLDVAQTYVAIDRFKDEDRNWVRETGKEPSTEGGRPMATFAITAEGRRAIKEKTEHMERLLKFQARASELSTMTAHPTRQQKRA